MTTDLTKFAKDNGLEYFMISFTDLFGGQRAKLVPARAIADMQEDGAALSQATDVTLSRAAWYEIYTAALGREVA